MEMNWEATGAIAELLAALGVIATLVYLAVQIKQQGTSQIESSHKEARGQSYQSLLMGLQNHFGAVALDETLSDIFRRGLASYESLNSLEQFRFNWVLGGYLVTNENAFYQKKDGILSEDRWDHLFRALKWYYLSPGVREWWLSYPKDTLHPEFAALIEEYIRTIEEAA